MYRRINVTLPEETLRLIDRVSTRGNRSRLIDKAVKQYVAESRRAHLRKRLKEGALRRADRDLRLAGESFFLERSMVEKRAVSYPRRGEVYLVNFDPVIGAEIRKTRPALIIQNDVANRYSPLTIVSAITSQYDEPLYPTEVLLKAGKGGTRKNSVILLNQIRSVDKRRLVRRLGSLQADIMHEVDRSIQISLGLVAI